MSVEDTIKNVLSSQCIMNYSEKARYWSKQIDKFQQEACQDINEILQEDARRLEILTQLSELGWDFVEEIDPELKFIILKVDQDNDDYPLKLSFPLNFPNEHISVESNCQIEYNKR